MIVEGIRNFIETNKTKKILDVGCGEGRFTESIQPVYELLLAGDREKRFFKGKPQGTKISYVCFNGISMPFRDDEFDLVYARAVLHHEKRWKDLFDEFFRISKEKVLVEEPFEDRRTEEKSNAYDAMEFFLKLQKEAGYEHYRYISPVEFEIYFDKNKIKYLKRVEKNDAEISFEEIFRGFDKFAEKSGRREFWTFEFEKLKKRFFGKCFSDDDFLIIQADKKGSVFDKRK
ncbi:class I SAM-dependent methyltransferase [candidate division WOR-3 bacterium]|nr:class I SAM-dependent methyltransferase [candidate division WOR-3 bacterium]